MNIVLLALVIACIVVSSVNSESSVVRVDHRNIEAVLSSPPVLLEFYAPWCKHCKSFEPYLDSVAEHLQDHDTAVGKIDIDASPAIAARFGVHTIPSFFLIRGRQVWKIENRRSVDEIVEFCTSEYESTQAIEMLASPLGPIGRIKGLLADWGGRFVDIMQEWSDSSGLPSFVPYVLISILFALSILFCTFAGIFYSVAHAKMD
jgi:thiol-disulfide isomerase/thioredoxin